MDFGFHSFNFNKMKGKENRISHSVVSVYNFIPNINLIIIK